MSTADPRLSNQSDPAGRASRGSRRQLQDYVNRFPQCLYEAILKELPRGTFDGEASIQWVSPLESDNYREYRDRSFLIHLGLAEAAQVLTEYWPRLGPCWDGLGIMSGPHGINPQVLLVEAKSHVDEIEGSGCRATESSLPLINEALEQTRCWLDAEDTPAWLGPLYQQANRLAHLNLLRNRLGIAAWLVEIYFINDPIGPASRAEWLPVIAAMHARLGLPKRPPFVIDLFLPALNPL